MPPDQPQLDQPQAVNRPPVELFGRHPGYGFAGYGVHTATGNYTEAAVDLGFPAGQLGLLDWTRTYNSMNTAGGTLGTGWSVAFGGRLTSEQGTPPGDTGPVLFHDEDGRVLTFTPRPTGGYQRPQDLAADLTRTPGGDYTLAYDSGESWQFDTTGRQTGRSAEDSGVTCDYDANGRLLRVTHSTGPQLGLSYDEAGRVSQVTADDGRTVSYTYGAGGALDSVTDPAGGATRFTWTAEGRVEQVTDADGNILVANRYDTDGRVSHQDFATGGAADFGYETASATTTVTSTPDGAVLRYSADASGRLTRLVDPAGNTTTCAYDANGYLSQAVSPGGTQLVQTHDERGNLMSSQFGGATSTYRYDGASRPTSVTDPNGATVGYAYTGSTQVPASVTDATGATTRFTSGGGRVQSMTDPDGNTTRYEYDRGGNLIAVTDPAGEVTRYGYDRAGHRTSQVTPSGARTSWEYDGAGRPTAVINPLGQATRYRYSAAGRLVESTDPTGAATRYEYDKAGQLLAVTDPLGRTTRYAYDAHGRLVSTTAPSGAVSRTEYDASGRVTATVDPTGATTRHAYDADGNLTEITDPQGNVTRRAYDARGNLISVTNPAGAVTRYGYDAADRQVTVTDPNGSVTRTEYDHAGRVVTTTDPAGGVTRQTWTPGGRLAASIDATGGVNRYAYGPTDRLIAVTDAEGGVSRYAYDADGRRTSTTTPAGLLTEYRYDPAGNLVVSVDPRGWITQYEFNARGQQTAAISPSGAVTRSRYDAASQLVETTDPNGSRTVFGYDAAGHLIEITDAKGAVRRFGYDAAGRVTSATDALGRTTTRAYDATGNLTTITDPGGHAQHFEYDAAGRQVRHRADDGTQVAFGYDAAGRRTNMTDGTGTTHYDYDAVGRVLSVTDPDGGTTTATYDQAGQRTSLTYPSGLRLDFRYNRNGHLVALHDSRAGRAVYALDADGRLVTEELPGRFARRYHHEHGMLTRYAVLHNGHAIAQTTFEYDPDGRIRAQHDAARESTHRRAFRYDASGQLVAARHWRQRPWPWEAHREPAEPWARDERGGYWHEHRDAAIDLDYDVVGNRTRYRRGEFVTRYRYDPADQLLAVESPSRRTEFRYDTSGRLTEEETGERHRRTEYDGFGRPVRVIRHGGSVTRRVDLTYSGDNLVTRIGLTTTDERHERERAAAVGYRWNTDTIPQILSQRAEPNIEDAEHDRPGRLHADFAYGYDRTFATWEHGAATFHADAFGSAVRTPDTEPWVRAERYDPFGVPEREEHGFPGREEHGFPEREEHGFPEPEEHRFPEREHGEDHLPRPELPRFGYRGELTLGNEIYLRNRWYNSSLGRFTVPDPLAQLPRPLPAISPYAYSGNNPINQTDPTGLWSLGSLVSSVVHGAQHAVSSAVHGAQHVVHAVTGAVTHTAQVIAGAAAHAFHTVATALSNVVSVARKDAAIAFHAVANAASHVVHTVRNAVSRSVGVVTHAVSTAASDAVQWVKKHNEIIGKIGTVLSNVSGALALAGLAIAPIPGLDALTPVLEGAALATAVGGLGLQAVAKAAGDKDITYGDLAIAAVGVIPGGGDIEDVAEGTNLAKMAGESAEGGGARTLFHYTNEAGLKGITDSNELRPSLEGGPDAHFGSGQYLTDISPRQVLPGSKASIPEDLRAQGYISRWQLAARLFRTPWKARQLTHYIEIDVSGLNVLHPDPLARPETFLIPGESPLDLTGRILRSGPLFPEG